MFHRGNTNVFFLPGLVTVMCKRARVLLLDTDEVLPMDPHFHPLLIRQASTSRSKRRKLDMVSSSQAAVEADDEGGKDDKATTLSLPSTRGDWKAPMLAPLQFHPPLPSRLRFSTASCDMSGGRV
uniref:Uncharacterized protein n=1 Tax=Solanum tuberosum TaxID=4113 RepID=M1D9D1_SOLTU